MVEKAEGEKTLSCHGKWGRRDLEERNSETSGQLQGTEGIKNFFLGIKYAYRKVHKP